MRRAHAEIGTRRLVAIVVSLVLFATVWPGAAQQQVVRVEGRVQWIGGEKMMVIPDNGDLPIEVDLKHAPLDNYMTLTQGDPVVVIGVVAPDGRKVIATSVRSGGG